MNLSGLRKSIEFNFMPDNVKAEVYARIQFPQHENIQIEAQPFKFGMYGHSMYAKFGDIRELRMGSCRHCPENTYKMSIDQTEPKENMRITKIMYSVKLYTTKDGKDELSYFKMQFLS